MHYRISRSLLFLSCVSLLAATPVASALKVDEVPERMTFLPFLNRYVTLPAEWSVRIDGTKATVWKTVRIEAPVSPPPLPSSFSSVSSKRRPSSSDRRLVRRNRRLGIVTDSSSSEPGSESSSSSSSAPSVVVTETSHSFIIGSFPTETCNVLAIQAMLDATSSVALKPEERAVKYERIPGALAAGYSWMEKGGTERHICVIPAGRIGTSETIVPASDTDTYNLVSQVLLQQLLAEVKRTRGQ